MINTENTYWSHEGKYQAFSELLDQLIPVEGSVAQPRKNPKLEKFRKASNCYYDLYNNGLGNRAREFYHVFGLAPSHYRVGGPHDHSQYMYDRTEEKMDQIILEAMIEQAPKYWEKQQKVRAA